MVATSESGREIYARRTIHTVDPPNEDDHCLKVFVTIAMFFLCLVCVLAVGYALIAAVGVVGIVAIAAIIAWLLFAVIKHIFS